MGERADVVVGTVKEILEHVKGVDGLARRLEDGADILHEVGLDSLETMEFMLEVESRLGIEIDFERLDFESLRSIRLFADALCGMSSGP